MRLRVANATGLISEYTGKKSELLEVVTLVTTYFLQIKKHLESCLIQSEAEISEAQSTLTYIEEQINILKTSKKSLNQELTLEEERLKLDTSFQKNLTGSREKLLCQLADLEREKENFSLEECSLLEDLERAKDLAASAKTIFQTQQSFLHSLSSSPSSSGT